MRVILIALFILGISAKAFVPPVSAILKEAMDGRKNGAQELNIRYQIRFSADSDPIVLQERMLNNRGKVQFIWKIADSGPAWGGSWNGKEYRIGTKVSWRSESRLFLKLFGAVTADEMASALLAEQFLRKDQLLQYKPGFEPNGDPAYWKTRDNYLVHPDILLRRLRENQLAYSITGYSDGKNKRTWYVDKSLGGITRFEWETPSALTTWSFFEFRQASPGGYYPFKLAFESSGATLIQGSVESIRAISGSEIKQLTRSYAEAARLQETTSEPMLGALKVLLSFR